MHDDQLNLKYYYIFKIKIFSYKKLWKENKKYSSFDIALLLDKGKDWHIKKSFTLRFFFIYLSIRFYLITQINKIEKSWMVWIPAVQIQFHKKKNRKMMFFFLQKIERWYLLRKPSISSSYQIVDEAIAEKIIYTNPCLNFSQNRSLIV